jgi:hypothetical protein
VNNCTCTVPGFIDVACPVAHDEFLPARCPCGAVWPPATWDSQRYPPCGGCGRVCITCCECDYNLAPDAPPCAVCGHGMPCAESCCATDHGVTGFRVHNERNAPEQAELAAIGLDDASLDATFDRVAHAVGPAAMARAAVALSAYGDDRIVVLDSLQHVSDPHATMMVPSPYANVAPNRAARRQHDRDVRRNRVGNSRGRR